MKEWTWFLFILCNSTCIYSMPKCCTGRNIFNGGCEDGGPMNIRDCEMTISLDLNDNATTYTMDKENNLIENGTMIATAQYFCMTTVQEDASEVVIFCLDEKDLATEETKRTVNVGFQLVSVFFIMLTIWVYLIVPQMLDLQGLCIIHSISGLAMGFIVLAVINLSGYLKPVPCHLLAYMMYFFFLYAFFWLNVLCFHIWRQVINPRFAQLIGRWRLFYHIYGIGGPCAFLAFLMIVNHSDFEYFRDIHPGIGLTTCWFESEQGKLIYFYGPMSVLLTMNIVLFIWTTIVLWDQSKNCTKTKVLKYRLKLYVKLFFIMGITWIFEVISAVVDLEEYDWIWYITDTFNALEGLIIFLILVVFRKRVVRALANRRMFMFVRLPAKWREAKDSECEEVEEVEEEFSLGQKIY